MNPIFLGFGSSLAMGIALAQLPFIKKNWATWLIAGVSYGSLTMLLSYLQTATDAAYLLGSELAFVYGGNFLGTFALLGFSIPKKKSWVRIFVGLLTPLLAGAAFYIIYLSLIPADGGRPLFENIARSVMLRSEQILAENMSAVIDNTTGVMTRQQGTYRDKNGKNPIADIIETGALENIREKRMGPLFRGAIKGNPRVNKSEYKTLNWEGKPTNAIIVSGDVTIVHKLTPYFHKEGKGQWDQTLTSELNLPFDAAFVLDPNTKDLVLLYYGFVIEP